MSPVFIANKWKEKKTNANGCPEAVYFKKYFLLFITFSKRVIIEPKLFSCLVGKVVIAEIAFIKQTMSVKKIWGCILEGVARC